MQSFESMFLEQTEEEEIRARMNLGPEYNTYYNGKWIIDTHHKLDRETTRGSESQDLFKKAIDWLLANNAAGNKQYLFVSKSTYMGMVIEYRKDKAQRVKGNNIVIITWLGDIRKPPINKKSPKEVFAKKGTQKVIVEANGEISFDIFVELD